MRLRPSRELLGKLSSAVLSQALLSAANFLVGLMLIRRTPPEQYGYYVLIVTAILLLTALQGAYLQPSLISVLTSQGREERRDFVGGLYREQGRRLLALAFVSAAVVAIFWTSGAASGTEALVALAAIIAALATLYREFFRMVLLAHRLPMLALRVDVFYVVLLGAGAYVATLTSMPAVAAALGLAIAALFGGWLLSGMVRRHEGWNIHGAPGVLRRIAHVGGWAVAGAAIHWMFAQGYIYVVASTLGVTAVATLSATRLLLMPINLMSSGMGPITFPTVSKWLQQHPVRTVFYRLCLLSAAVAGLAVAYILFVWLLRDWIFANVIKTQIPDRDTLLVMWSAVFLLMAVRDQMIFLPAARGRFPVMAWLTLVTAVLSLLIGFVCMRKFGVFGALVGVLSGEAINILGFVLLSFREIRLSEDETPVPVANS